MSTELFTETWQNFVASLYDSSAVEHVLICNNISINNNNNNNNNILVLRILEYLVFSVCVFCLFVCFIFRNFNYSKITIYGYILRTDLLDYLPGLSGTHGYSRQLVLNIKVFLISFLVKSN